MESKNNIEKVNTQRLLLFLFISFGLSNIFRFDVFHFNEFLEKEYQWFYLVIECILEGSGIFIAGIIGLLLLRKQREVEISFWGTSNSKSLLVAIIPTILLTVIGVPNKYGLNIHIFGLIASFGTLIYCIMEEYGWRGYLQEEFQSLKPIIKFFLIGFIWYTWHLSFFTNATLTDNLFFLGMLILGSWGIGKIQELTKSILVCSCFHFIVNIFMYNHFFNNTFSGTSKLIILGTCIILWIGILIKWTNNSLKNNL